MDRYYINYTTSITLYRSHAEIKQVMKPHKIITESDP
jgi:hypothetical protein